MLSEINKIRVESNMSIRALSIKSGISKSLIGRIENSQSIPKIDIVCKLAKALNMNPEILFSILVRDENFDKISYIKGKEK